MDKLTLNLIINSCINQSSIIAKIKKYMLNYILKHMQFIYLYLAISRFKSDSVCVLCCDAARIFNFAVSELWLVQHEIN